MKKYCPRFTARHFYVSIIVLYCLLWIIPTPINSFDKNCAVTDAGSYLIIAPDHTLIAWGNNEHGLVGNGSLLFYPYIARKTVLKNVVSVYSNGWTCAMALDKNNDLWGWGYSKLSLQEGAVPFNRPVKIMENVKSVGLGSFHAAVLQTDGSLWVWGYNIDGQLGLGNSDNSNSSYVPRKIMDDVLDVFAFYELTFAITSGHDLYVWGSNLLQEQVSDMYRPTLAASNICAVTSISIYQYMLLTTDGRVLLFDTRLGLQDKSYSNAIQETPIAEHVTELLSRGFITEDGSTYWIDQIDEQGHITFQEENSILFWNHRLKISADGKFYFLPLVEWLPAIPQSIYTLSPFLRNLFILGLIWNKYLYPKIKRIMFPVAPIE